MLMDLLSLNSFMDGWAIESVTWRRLSIIKVLIR